jgi:hypothetical protein
MSNQARIGPDGRDDDLTRALRELYAAPADDRYWAALARHIMRRIAAEAEPDVWWVPLAHWARIGIVAAGLAVVAAGVAFTRSRAVETTIAYQRVIETPQSAPLQIATEHAVGSDREATLRFVIAP